MSEGIKIDIEKKIDNLAKASAAVLVSLMETFKHSPEQWRMIPPPTDLIIAIAHATPLIASWLMTLSSVIVGLEAGISDIRMNIVGDIILTVKDAEAKSRLVAKLKKQELPASESEEGIKIKMPWNETSETIVENKSPSELQE